MTAPRPSSRLIRAHKRGWPRHAVRELIRRKLRQHFHGIHAQGIDRLRAALDDDPAGVLFLANHSSWWDFFMAHWLNEAVPVDGYGMTEHSNLVKFGFFRRIGAYSVDRGDSGSVRASLDYTLELLGRPRAGVWLFPQGVIACNDARPLAFQGGLRLLLRRAGGLRIVPVALRYEYWQDERPEAFARFGEATWADRAGTATVLDTWRGRLTSELDSLTADVLTQDAGRFEPILSGRGSINDRYARLRERLGGPPADYSTSRGDRDQGGS
ncbi:lysophospholipid acyltransferase family protein [Tautonia plasticadhaerens]|uniref:Acyltransferase n=1 Tax=Tautonia plasticadhaerens TaxID=2527974 RepID=A0A518H731_9BACT|nr:lysophospholipid acyltransferase family protein [Tautonia plasticadhaerens]QDV36581.1 Acyltransferase [Tautonia plasticadhaerens]